MRKPYAFAATVAAIVGGVAACVGAGWLIGSRWFWAAIGWLLVAALFLILSFALGIGFARLYEWFRDDEWVPFALEVPALKWIVLRWCIKTNRFNGARVEPVDQPDPP